MSKVQDFWKNKQMLLLWLYSIGVLLLGFLLCRFVFIGLHGMKEWPVDLLIVGLVVHLISLFIKKRYVPWFASIGYFVGFWAGVLLHKEGIDPGGGTTDNLWQIWTILFLGCILAGVVVEIYLKWRKILKK